VGLIVASLGVSENLNGSLGFFVIWIVVSSCELIVFFLHFFHLISSPSINVKRATVYNLENGSEITNHKEPQEINVESPSLSE
jgi:hypothetical protein